jgi:hypothetical protein
MVVVGLKLFESRLHLWSCSARVAMAALRFGFSDNGLVDPRKIYREGTAQIIFLTSFKSLCTELF